MSVIGFMGASYVHAHDLSSMPHHIAQPTMIRPVKPYQLIAALMAREGLGPTPLARKLGDRTLQPKIHRFKNGEVREPSPATVTPLAQYFGLPLEAFYDEKTATRIATERGVKALPEVPVAKKPRTSRPAGLETVSEQAITAARLLDDVRDAVKRDRILAQWNLVHQLVTAGHQVSVTISEQAITQPAKARKGR